MKTLIQPREPIEMLRQETPRAPVSISLRAFRNAARKQESILAPAERRALLYLAARMPAWVTPDHLTLLGFLAMALAGASFAAARWWPPALVAGCFWIAVNWFGDSLDGTLARVRNRQRPRYGFYVDHMADAFGTVFLLGGLAASGYMSAAIAGVLLIVYSILCINVYLATYTLGTFELSFWKFSPTEVRILLIAGNTVSYVQPRVFGGHFLFYDVAGGIAAAVLAVVLVVSTARNTAALYREEKL